MRDSRHQEFLDTATDAERQRYELFMSIATTPAKLSRRLNRLQTSCNFTGSAKWSMAVDFAKRRTFGRPARLGPVISDNIVYQLLGEYGQRKTKTVQWSRKPQSRAAVSAWHALDKKWHTYAEPQPGTRLQDIRDTLRRLCDIGLPAAAVDEINELLRLHELYLMETEDV